MRLLLFGVFRLFRGFSPEPLRAFTLPAQRTSVTLLIELHRFHSGDKETSRASFCKPRLAPPNTIAGETELRNSLSTATIEKKYNSESCSQRMIVLGIETSGRAGSVALAIDGEVRAERELAASGRRHARTLIPELGDLLKSQGLAAAGIDAVAVSIGPGSFTGLRVGIVCAKTLAYALGCRIVGVDTFLAVAAAQDDIENCWVIDDALRGDIFAGEYRRDNGNWRCVVEPGLVSLADWRTSVPAPMRVTGPGVDKLRGDLAGLRLSEHERSTPWARQIALLGNAAVLAGHVDDPWTLEPRYIRRSAAEEKADAGRATAP
jgi:tRNA threonylcarbamoyladenosine biosynthesis protein TsaB